MAIDRVVSVAGHDVGQTSFDQADAGGSGGGAETAGDGKRGQLHEASQLNPSLHPFKFLAEDGIALGMGHNGHDTGSHQASENRFGVATDMKVGTFDEEVLAGVDGIGGEALHEVVDVIEAEMEFAADMDLRRDTNGCGEFLDSPLRQIVIEDIAGIGVRRGDDVGGAAIAGGLQHGNAFFDAGWAIIDSPEDVTMDIDHLVWRGYAITNRSDAFPVGAERLSKPKQDRST